MTTEPEAIGTIKDTDVTPTLIPSPVEPLVITHRNKCLTYETAKEIETRIARYFGIRANVIVPNVSWGLLTYEADMLIMPISGVMYEVEIKVSKGDLIADKKKNHKHCSELIRGIYFAIPEKLKPHIEHIPEKAGILVVDKTGRVEKLRGIKINKTSRKLSEQERFTLARLGAMRVWILKEKLVGAL